MKKLILKYLYNKFIKKSDEYRNKAMYIYNNYGGTGRRTEMFYYARTARNLKNKAIDLKKRCA